MTKYRIAAVQMVSSPNVTVNLAEAARLIELAVDAGAELVVLPENFAHMGRSDFEKLEVREQAGRGPIQDFLSQQARDHGTWIVGGTIPLASGVPNKVRAACILYNTDGVAVARYDKMHLFDVTVEGKGTERYMESETIDPGTQVVVADTTFGRVGLAVCYDLRFPELFRAMVRQGMELIALPSAFTAVTGSAHWETLVRARAIENLCYVVAAGQGGYHASGRETYGDSMIVDPWGTVLDRIPKGAGVIVQEIDRERLHTTRRNFPAISHIKL